MACECVACEVDEATELRLPVRLVAMDATPGLCGWLLAHNEGGGMRFCFPNKERTALCVLLTQKALASHIRKCRGHPDEASIRIRLGPDGVYERLRESQKAREPAAWIRVCGRRACREPMFLEIPQSFRATR